MLVVRVLGVVAVAIMVGENDSLSPAAFDSTLRSAYDRACILRIWGQEELFPH